MIYLAQPFKHNDPEVMENRYKFAVDFTAKKHERGYRIYSPIVHSYHLNQAFKKGPKDFSFWRIFDFHMLSKADQLWILTMDGWRESEGVQTEMDFAKALGIPYTLHLGDVDDEWLAEFNLERSEREKGFR